MSFNGSGTYVPPAGQPVATGTVIQSATFNTLVTDIGNTFNNVLPRDGQAAMQGPIKITDGTSTIPGIAFNSEASTGIYRPIQGTLAMTAAGVENLRINGAGHVLIGTTTDDGTNTLQVGGPAKVSGAATLASTLNVTGATTVAALGVTGAATLSSTLAVSGISTFSNRTLMGGAADDTTTALQVSSAGGSLLSLNTTNANGSFMKLSNSGTTFSYLGSGKALVGTGALGDLAVRSETGAILFSSGATERARIDTSGNLMLGTTTQVNSGRLTVQASLTGNAGLAFLKNTDSTGGAAWTTADDTGTKYCEIGVLNSASNVGVTYGAAGEGYVRSSASANGLTLSAANTAGYIRFLTNAGAERARIDASGNFLIGSATSAYPAKLVVSGTGSSTNATTDSVISLAGYNATTDQLRLLFNHNASGMAGIGTPMGGGLMFGRATGSTGAVSNEWARINNSGNFLIGQTSDDGVGKLQVAGNLRVNSGNLYLTGQSMLGGATSTYGGYSSAATINYSGIGTQYGIVLKPATSTANTNAISFLSSASTYTTGAPVANIVHLSGDAGMNLTGTWQLNGNPVASTNAPTLTNPTVVGYIEQFQYLNPGATVTINPGAGTLIELSITANTTITLPAAVAGMSYTIIASYTGAYSLTFAGGSTLRWAGGAAPVATSVNGKSDKYVFTCGATYTLAQDGGRGF